MFGQQSCTLWLLLIPSDWNPHEERPILYPVQLRQQNHPSNSIAMYPIQVLAITRERSSEESRSGDWERRVSLLWSCQVSEPHAPWFVRLLTIRCNITEDGKAALLKLSKGDMRRALNVLQVSPLRLRLVIVTEIRHAMLHMTRLMKRRFIRVRVIHNLRISRR